VGNCEVEKGLKYATEAKSKDSVDVFFGAPCSLG